MEPYPNLPLHVQPWAGEKEWEQTLCGVLIHGQGVVVGLSHRNTGHSQMWARECLITSLLAHFPLAGW